MSYEFKTEDAYGLARAIGADIHEKGDELFFKYCPQCRGCLLYTSDAADD